MSILPKEEGFYEHLHFLVRLIDMQKLEAIDSQDRLFASHKTAGRKNGPTCKVLVLCSGQNCVQGVTKFMEEDLHLSW